MMIEILVRSQVLDVFSRARLILAYASAPPLTVVTDWAAGLKK
jgi:hypothetical protein